MFRAEGAAARRRAGEPGASSLSAGPPEASGEPGKGLASQQRPPAVATRPFLFFTTRFTVSRKGSSLKSKQMLVLL